MEKLIRIDILNQIKREYDFRHNEAQNKYDLAMKKIREEYPEIFEINNKIRKLSVKDAKNLINNQPRLYKKEILKLMEDEKKLYAKYDLLNKLPSKYLCNACMDSGIIKKDKFCTQCYYEVFLKAVYKNNTFYNLLKRATFDNIDKGFFLDVNKEQGYPDINETIDNLKKISQDMVQNLTQKGNYERYNTIILQGYVATGKTYLSLCIANELIKAGIYVAIFSAVELADILLSYNENAKELKESIINSKVVLIDDFGTEYINDFYLSQLHEFFNKRKIKNLPTIITTNKSMKNIGSDYSERVKSRLIEKSFIKPFQSIKDKREN